MQACLENKELKDDAIEEAAEVISVLMYNMSQVFNASKIILAGSLMDFKEHFEAQLLEHFHRLDTDSKVDVVVLEGTKNVVYGAAMIAVQEAIDAIEV